jgi:hypothetical protein
MLGVDSASGQGNRMRAGLGARRIKAATRAGPAAGVRRTRDDEPMTARTIEPVVWALEMCAGFLSKRDQTQAVKNDWTNVLYSSPRRLDGDAGSINNLNRHIVEGLFRPMSRAVNEVSCLVNYELLNYFFLRTLTHDRSHYSRIMRPSRMKPCLPSVVGRLSSSGGVGGVMMVSS